MRDSRKEMPLYRVSFHTSQSFEAPFVVRKRKEVHFGLSFHIILGQQKHYSELYVYLINS